MSHIVPKFSPYFSTRKKEIGKWGDNLREFYENVYDVPNELISIKLLSQEFNSKKDKWLGFLKIQHGLLHLIWIYMALQGIDPIEPHKIIAIN